MANQAKANSKEIAAILSQDISKSKKMIALYDLGLEIKAIADALGVRYNFAYNVISNYANINGLELRTNTKTNKKEIIIEAHKAGKSNKEIAAETQTNYNYVYKIIKEFKAMA